MNRIVYAGKHLTTYAVTRHIHTSWELIYCTGGSGNVQAEGRDYPYGKDDVLIIPPNIPHTNFSEEGFTNFHINMEEPTFHFSAPSLMRGDASGFLRNAFAGAFFHFSKPAPSFPFLASYGDLISNYVLTLHAEPAHSESVEQIIDCIVRNYPDADFELDEYLRAFPFSYDYLRKLFKKETGVTPNQFLINKRLEIAASCLCADPSRSVSEIAHLCGYREPLYFSRMFKKFYGVSPSGYLEHVKTLQSEHSALDSDSMKILL